MSDKWVVHVHKEISGGSNGQPPYVKETRTEFRSGRYINERSVFAPRPQEPQQIHHQRNDKEKELDWKNWGGFDPAYVAKARAKSMRRHLAEQDRRIAEAKRYKPQPRLEGAENWFRQSEAKTQAPQTPRERPNYLIVFLAIGVLLGGLSYISPQQAPTEQARH